MTDTRIALLPGGLIKGYAVVYGRRTLKMGLYWTSDSDVRLAHPRIPLVKHHLVENSPQVGMVVDHGLDSDGLWVIAAMYPGEYWEAVRSQIRAGREWYFCPTASSRLFKVDPVDMRIERYIVTAIMATFQPEIIPACFDGALSYLGAALEEDREMPPFIHPVYASLPMLGSSLEGDDRLNLVRLASGKESTNDLPIT